MSILKIITLRETKIDYYRLKSLLFLVSVFIWRGKYYPCCLFPITDSLLRTWAYNTARLRSLQLSVMASQKSRI